MQSFCSGFFDFFMSFFCFHQLDFFRTDGQSHLLVLVVKFIASDYKLKGRYVISTRIAAGD